MPFSILYEDADVVAVNKPAGIMTHPDDRSTAETMQDIVERAYPGAEYAHRLDKDTSGVLVFAKNIPAKTFLRQAFTDRAAHKTYLAIVYGVLAEKRGVIDFDIGRSRKDFRLRSAQPKARGTMRDAITRYEVLGETLDRKHSLVRLEPETGRTHQIRVHLKAIHHPVVADPLYAPNHPQELGMERLALHSYSLDLPLPSGGRTTIVAPLPRDLAGAVRVFSGAGEGFAAE